MSSCLSILAVRIRRWQALPIPFLLSLIPRSSTACPVSVVPSRFLVDPADGLARVFMLIPRAALRVFSTSVDKSRIVFERYFRAVCWPEIASLDPLVSNLDMALGLDMAIWGPVLISMCVLEGLGVKANVVAARTPIAERKAVIFMLDV